MRLQTLVGMPSSIHPKRLAKALNVIIVSATCQRLHQALERGQKTEMRDCEWGQKFGMVKPRLVLPPGDLPKRRQNVLVRPPLKRRRTTVVGNGPHQKDLVAFEVVFTPIGLTSLPSKKQTPTVFPNPPGCGTAGMAGIMKNGFQSPWFFGDQTWSCCKLIFSLILLMLQKC